MGDDKLIDFLGGGTVLAQKITALGKPCDRNNVYNWKRMGKIPPAWRPWVADIALKEIEGFDTSAFLRGEAA